MPISSTSDKVLGAALASCELALGVAKDTAEYAAKTRVGRLASGGADLAVGGMEKVVEFLIPPAKDESGICPRAASPSLGSEVAPGNEQSGQGLIQPLPRSRGGPAGFPMRPSSLVSHWQAGESGGPGHHEPVELGQQLQP